jgi:hydroxymethylpyrimidine pyrophosphatase-like HAD family hydrolase
MMMFASDLDRTLIYSKRALDEMNTPWNETMICVEKRNGEEVSFMTGHSFQLLKELAKKLLFVPVTTRTYEQYKRVFIFNEDIPVLYCVTSNGAKIHYKGKVLTDWENLVKARLTDECISMEDLQRKLDEFSLNGTLKIADNLFFYYILESKISLDTKNSLIELAKSNGWKVSLQGRKLYFMPLPICKGEAVKFIQKREGIEVLAGAGDSLLDFPFLEVCSHSYIPKHGELALEDILQNDHSLSQQQGAFAGEEIIRKVHQLIYETNYSVGGSLKHLSSKK